MDEEICPCGSGVSRGSCCKKVMRDGAETPEQLMRSRYCAFLWGDVDYLLKTTHEDMLSPGMRFELQQACQDNEFLSLRVIEARPSKRDEGFVEFVAYSRQGGVTAELHEKSRFLREDGRWLYQSGKVLPHYKLGANEPCWCGSGKKLKKCHRV